MEEEILLEAGRLEYLQVFLNKKKKKKETRVFISYRRIGLDSQKKTKGIIRPLLVLLTMCIFNGLKHEIFEPQIQ